MDIVCFPGVLFDKLPWTNRQRIMLELAKRHRVLYVEPPKLPLLQAYKTVARVMPEQRTHRWFGRLLKPEKRESNFWVLAQLAIVPERWPTGRRLNARFNASMLRRRLKRLGVDDPIVWVYSPDAVSVVDHLGFERVVFDAVDDYPAQPYYRRHLRGIEDDQMRIARRAAVIFTSARKLQAQFSQYNSHCYYMGNAADVEHFSTPSVAAEPNELAHIPHPRVGFVGALDDYKVDADLLRAVAELQPTWQFVLIGPEGVAGKSSRASALRELPNVHMLGARPHSDLPAYLSGMDACIIPYRLNRYTESCFPLKFFEFLAAGKAVVSTPLPELLPYASLARLAATAEEFVRALEAALREDSPELREARLAIARENTWGAKADRMQRIVEELGV